MKLSCVLNYPHDQEITTVFWSKTAVTDGETPNLCLVPEYRGGVQCDSKYKDTYSLTLTSVTEADKHMYYCRFTTNRGTWTGIPGAQLDVTGRANDLSETHTHTHARTHVHTHTHTHTRWFLWFTGTLHRRNGFYTVQTVCAIALHLPYT